MEVNIRYESVFIGRPELARSQLESRANEQYTDGMMEDLKESLYRDSLQPMQ